jgi:5-formyltetrahydrofolate cyclo-ligase
MPSDSDPQPSDLRGQECRERKRAVRERALAARDELSQGSRAEKSARITETLLAHPFCDHGAAVMAYASIQSEFDTRALIETALAAGRVVALPRIVAPRVMIAVQITDPGRDLEPGRFGIPTPVDGLETIPPSAFGCVLVPGSAFDLLGRRLGYGGGFYDTFLAQTAADCPYVAAAFEAQLVDEVPVEPHDCTMDLLVTESRVVEFSG